jgi:alpha-N-arabinofuranosidase
LGLFVLVIRETGLQTTVFADVPLETIEVKVHDRVLHEIDSRLFGQFMEKPSWGSEIGPEGSLIPGTHQLRPEAKELIRQMQIPVARFPGGTDVDYIDWLDMIDNPPGRPSERPVTIGHTGARVTNNFGYDEFLRLAEELDIEAILVVNFRDGLLDEEGPQKAARHAAELVAYSNALLEAPLPDDLAVWPRLRAANGHPAPYGVKYFQIGNETWAFAEKASEDRYLATLEAYIEAIHAVDPTVRIIVDGQPEELAARVYRQLGERIDYFAVHHYQPWQMSEIRRGDEVVDVAGVTAQDVWYAWAAVPGFDDQGQSVFQRPALDQARKLGYRVGMTEWNWNGWWRLSGGALPPLDSLFAKGIGAAGMLHAMMRSADVVRLAAQSMLIGDGWGIHAVYCDRHGRTPPYMIPTGQVTALYSRYHGDQRLEIGLAGMPCYEQPYRLAGIAPSSRVAYLDLVATRSENRLYLHAINRHYDRPLSIQVDVSALKREPAKKGTLHILEGRLDKEPPPGEPPAPGRIREETFPIPGDHFQVTLPNRTVSVVEIPLD